MKTNNQFTNRILSLVLSLVMVLSMLPMNIFTASAAETTEPAPVCDCGTDDPAIHATTCTVYVAPENPRCFCTEKCTEVNEWCDVCGFDYTACTGTDTAVQYDGGAIDLSTLTETYLISDSGEYIFTGTGSYGIKVESGYPKIVLNNINISLTDGDYYDNNPINGIHIAGGTTEILVMGENSITAEVGAGIFVAEGGTVKITGSSREDILIATGASGCSGIGGYVYYTNGSVNCGNIEISNVTVKAFGSDSSMGDRTPAKLRVIIF